MTVATVEMGLGAHRALAVGGRGRVVAVYRRAAYVRVPGGLFALTTADVGRGPLHLRSPVRPDRLAPGDLVDVVAGAHVRIGTAVVDLTHAALWRGALPDRHRLATAGAVADVFAAAAPPALSAPMFADRLGVAVHRLGQDDLIGVARAIGGLGPGLTPAGDDTLAGILLVARAMGGEAVEEELLTVARAATTTSVSRGLLDWAARGQAVEPVHDLLAALAAGDMPKAAIHLSVLGRLGHTSGADLAYGLRLGLARGAWYLGERVSGVTPA
ncbi:MAG: hypothetical protein QOG43_795 [Actinomycetota bacterium]|nr:hypothetical protein [Actinomycetota bacterium]